MFGSTAEAVTLPWSWAIDRLSASTAYWVATVRPDGRPHTRPVWGVVVDEVLHFSTGSLATPNLLRRNELTVHTESSCEVVIVEGTAQFQQDRATVEEVCRQYEQKYHEALDPDDLPGPFWEVTPRLVFGWLAAPNFDDGGAAFHGTATRWTFPP
jgi:hypothetical protein